MSLQEKLNQDIKAAMLAREQERLGTLRMLKSILGYVQIEKKSESIPDADFVTVVQKEIKKRRDAAEQYQTGGRPELAQKEQAEIVFLEPFLPQPLTEAELESLVREAIAETGAASKKDLGPVIKAVQARAQGRADGKSISQMAGKLLP